VCDGKPNTDNWVIFRKCTPCHPKETCASTTGNTLCADGPAPSSQYDPPSAPPVPTVTVGVVASAHLTSGIAQALSAQLVTVGTHIHRRLDGGRRPSHRRHNLARRDAAGRQPSTCADGEFHIFFQKHARNSPRSNWKNRVELAGYRRHSRCTVFFCLLIVLHLHNHCT
jgi:hypothetical protein